MPFEMVLSETTTEGVLILTLNDPATLNSVRGSMMEELASEIDRFESDRSLRTLIITGAGRSFCSGANLRGFAQDIAQSEAADEAASNEPRIETSRLPWPELDPVYAHRETARVAVGPALVQRLHNLQKPSFAAVNGYALGFGCGLALSCDFRVAGVSARFSEAFIRNGVVPGDGSAWQLPKLVGMSRALWMQYSGDYVSGEEAVRIGLANWCVPDDQLMDKALELATKLARGPIFAMGMVKMMIHEGYQQDLAAHLPLSTRALAITRQTYDHKEGIQAFIEKREPKFRGY